MAAAPHPNRLQGTLQLPTQVYLAPACLLCLTLPEIRVIGFPRALRHPFSTHLRVRIPVIHRCTQPGLIMYPKKIHQVKCIQNTLMTGQSSKGATGTCRSKQDAPATPLQDLAQPAVAAMCKGFFLRIKALQQGLHQCVPVVRQKAEWECPLQLQHCSQVSQLPMLQRKDRVSSTAYWRWIATTKQL